MSIYQFWDKNPLIWPWMEKFLPSNNYFSDGIVTLVGFILAAAIIYFFTAYIYESEPLLVAMFAFACWHFPGGWWSRWAKATMKFGVAQRSEREANGG